MTPNEGSLHLSPDTRPLEKMRDAGPLLRFLQEPALSSSKGVGTSTAFRGGSDFIKPKHPISAASMSIRRKSRRVGQPIYYYFEEIKI
jgi:hypothetical protein